jgi:hypothetical protein
MSKITRILFILAISIVGSFFCAIFFIWIFTLSLPSTDSAYGQGLVSTLMDPFVRIIAIQIAAVSSVFTFLLLYFGLRRTSMKRSIPIVFAVVILEILLITPIAGYVAWLGSYVALVLAVFYCRKREKYKIP